MTERGRPAYHRPDTMLQANDRIEDVDFEAAGTVLSEAAGGRALNANHVARWLITIEVLDLARGISEVSYRRRIDATTPWGPWILTTVTIGPGATGEILFADGDVAGQIDLKMKGDGGTTSASVFLGGKD